MLIFNKLRTLNPSPRYIRIVDRLEQYVILTRLNRPIGIYLLLWPTLWALWIAARGWPDWGVLIVFTLGVVLMRSAGCAVNDFADRDIDPHVARTRDRPLAAGRITSREALLVFAALSIIAFLLVLTMNRLTVYMSFVGIVLAASYPFMKRFHYMPQVHLGMAFGWAVPMAFAAQANEVTNVTWLLFIATVLWATVYDTMYAMADREDDLKVGAKSTAILFGDADRFIIGILQLLLLLDLVLIGRQSALGLYYYLGLGIATGLALYHQYLIRERKPEDCFRAFLHNSWLGFAVFVGIVVDYWVS